MLSGPFHDFWLLEEETYAYTDEGFWGRRDAPVRLSDSLLSYFVDTLDWIPTLNPGIEECSARKGLNWYGPTIINHEGGALFQQIFTSWAQLFSHGPEHLKVRGLFELHGPVDESENVGNEEHVKNGESVEDKESEEGEEKVYRLGSYEYLDVEREWLIQSLTTLAQFGQQAATGKFFILHLGI